MITDDTSFPSQDTTRALKLLDSGKGSLRSDSRHYQQARAAIESSPDPLQEAKKVLERIQKERQSRLSQAIRNLVRLEGEISRRLLWEVMDLIRQGFPRGHLDPQHYVLRDKFEDQISKGTATLESLLELAQAMTLIEVYDPRQPGWNRFRGASL